MIRNTIRVLVVDDEEIARREIPETLREDCGMQADAAASAEECLQRLQQAVLEENSYDAVVLDPPRSGAKRRVVTQVVSRRPRAVAYVACDPAALARDVAIPRATAHRYLGLLEASFQLVRLQPYSVNRTRRLVKGPKLYWCDTGLAMHLSGDATPQGAQFENLVLSDLLAWRDAQIPRPEILYWRTATDLEVDFVIEHGRRLGGTGRQRPQALQQQHHHQIPGVHEPEHGHGRLQVGSEEDFKRALRMAQVRQQRPLRPSR